MSPSSDMFGSESKLPYSSERVPAVLHGARMRCWLSDGDEELKAVEIESVHTVEIESFVRRADVDEWFSVRAPPRLDQCE
jgi:hypothetical protein